MSLNSRSVPDNEGMVEESSVHRSGREQSDFDNQSMVNRPIAKS